MTAQTPELETPPPATDGANRRWLVWMVLCAIVGLTGALSLDRFMDPHQLQICPEALAPPAVTPCIAATASPGEGLWVSMQRYATQSNSALHGILALVRVLLYVLFAVGALELILSFLEFIGTPGFTLQEMRRRFQESKGKDSAEGASKGSGFSFALFKELVFQPQFLIPITAALGVGGTVVYEVSQDHDGEDTRITRIEESVNTMRNEVSVMLQTLVISDGGEKFVPVSAPEIAAALRELNEKGPERQLAKLQVDVDEIAVVLNGLAKKLPPDDFRELLARLNGKLGGVGKQVEVIRTQQEQGLTQLVAIGTNVQNANGGIGDLMKVGERTESVAKSTRLAIGRFPVFRRDDAEGFDTIAGGLSRLIRHEDLLAKTWLRYPVRKVLKDILEQAPDKKYACKDPATCEPLVAALAARD